MLANTHRFHGHNSLSYVYKNGTALRSSLLTVRYIVNTRRKHPRVAVVVSKKIYKGAVGRNKILRRIYEWFRLNIQSFSQNYDIVCIVSSAEIRTMTADELSGLLSEMIKPLLDTLPKK